MKRKKITSKKFLQDTVISRISRGISLKEIRKELKITRQNLHYYVGKLLKEGIIRRIGEGQYEVVKISEHHRKKRKKIRGHAFIWKIKLERKYNWEDRLKKRNIKYKLIRNCIPRIIIKNRKIWLGKKTLTIYEINSFYARNAIESRKYAVISLKEIVDTLQLKLEVNLGRFEFQPSREHFGMIKNDLAIQCNRNGERIYVRDDKEGEWLWIDNSYAMGELETGGKKALTRSLQVQNWWNDNKKYNFEVTPSFLMESIKGLVNVQQMHSNNIIKHQKVLDEMLVTLKKIQRGLDK